MAWLVYWTNASTYFHRQPPWVPTRLAMEALLTRHFPKTKCCNLAYNGIYPNQINVNGELNGLPLRDVDIPMD
jgi:hypothetical protein